MKMSNRKFMERIFFKGFCETGSCYVAWASLELGNASASAEALKLFV
jgi:hypothetical protein